jgi:hypothetical protein
MVPLLALPAAGASPPEVVATGLNSPYKLTEGPDGAIYVAEAGLGGSTCITIQGPEGEEIEACSGTSGSVTRIAGDTFNRPVTGLASVAIGPDEVIGPQAVGFDSADNLHVVLGLGGDEDIRAASGQDQLGTLIQVSSGGDVTTVADLVAFEEANDPDKDLPGTEGPDSNPFGLAFDGTDALVADAGANALLRVAADGTTTVEAVFGPRFVDPPPFIPVPGQIPMQAVPTAVEIDSNDMIHVSQLTGFPFPVDGANIFSVDNGVVTAALTGFTNIIDFAVADDGTMYVLEFASNGLLSETPEPALLQVRTDGTQKTLLHGADLPVPGGVAVGSNGMVYLSVCTLCGPGQGMVWMIDPSIASDANAASACDPDDVPGTSFDDIAPSIHREAIECAAWWGVVNGFAPDRFGPTEDITREQSASMIARALTSAGVDLPAAAPDAFPDDNGSVHEADINALAAAGIVKGRLDGTFDPSAKVSREEVTSLLARAYATATGSALPAGKDAFTDDDGSIHEADINAVAAAGWVQGVGGGLFKPTDKATRGEFSSMITRTLATLVDEAVATTPTT